jgi:UDP-glucose 4-epimerase
MKTKVIVIGSKGFIGSNLVKHLESCDYDIWECDVNTHMSPKYFSINAQNTTFDDVFKEGFDVCINCSGAADVPASLKNPLFDYRLNTDNVFKMLDSIKNFSSQCKFVNLSSAAVYGNPERLPITEDCKLAPVSPYGWHKLHAENICREFYESFNIKTISLRIFSAYGEGIRKQLLWDVYQKSLHSNNIEFWGTGNETRDFIYISDLLQIIQIVIENAVFDGTAINAANGEEIFIKDVIATTLSELSWKGSFNFIGKNRKGDPTRWVANIDKLLSLGYKRQYLFEQGVENYCKWLK